MWCFLCIIHRLEPAIIQICSNRGKHFRLVQTVMYAYIWTNLSIYWNQKTHWFAVFGLLPAPRILISHNDEALIPDYLWIWKAPTKTNSVITVLRSHHLVISSVDCNISVTWLLTISGYYSSRISKYRQQVLMSHLHYNISRQYFFGVFVTLKNEFNICIWQQIMWYIFSFSTNDLNWPLESSIYKVKIIDLDSWALIWSVWLQYLCSPGTFDKIHTLTRLKTEFIKS